MAELRMMHRGDSRAASRHHGPRRGHRCVGNGTGLSKGVDYHRARNSASGELSEDGGEWIKEGTQGGHRVAGAQVITWARRTAHGMDPMRRAPPRAAPPPRSVERGGGAGGGGVAAAAGPAVHGAHMRGLAQARPAAADSSWDGPGALHFARNFMAHPRSGRASSRCGPSQAKATAGPASAGPGRA